ncbi:lipase family protein [Roseomonas sp. NAR14]|uniref:Lipase family protein n=1 Tax=Roseomonas acroporae TaxID=2937791 RepID=A0A9X1Y9A9_9PROT|nr:alpha/beta fold hydrolase [Roseomonas acroporae]MCK8786514.1 lipase family protein [Roseomonas acroporae]
MAGPPGTPIRWEPLDGAPLGASAYRILYRSTGLRGEPVAVSGVIVIPAGAAPDGGRPVVAWAHPTTGVVPRCAPSRALLVFQMIQGLRSMVRRGYVVVATDYPGLGTAGPHPYLVGTSAGRAVLDSVRAAQRFPGAAAGDRFVVWGHSQGGHAALYTGLLARDYAPELRLLGVAAAAPATEIGVLLDDDIGTPAGRNLTAMTLWSWARVFDAPLERVATPQAMPVIDALAQECIESPLDLLIRERTARPLGRSFLAVPDLTAVEPWRALLADNTPGTLPPDLPVFLAQGGADAIVRPTVTADYARRLCRAGSAVRRLVLPGVGHGFIATDSAVPAVDWMADRFAGRPAPDDCGAP